MRFTVKASTAFAPYGTVFLHHTVRAPRSTDFHRTGNLCLTLMPEHRGCCGSDAVATDMSILHYASTDVNYFLWKSVNL